jgi:hypothetical protein
LDGRDAWNECRPSGCDDLKNENLKWAINLTWNDIRGLKIIKKREYNDYYLLGWEGCMERM